MICRVCTGGQYFFAVQRGRLRWFSCPSCNGLGTIDVDAPVKIQMNNKIGKAVTDLNRRLDRDEVAAEKAYWATVYTYSSSITKHAYPV